MTAGTKMRTLGLIGGMSWESTALYYASLNRGIADQMGGLHSAPLLMASVDFQGIVDHQLANRWDQAGAELADIARRLEDAGAEGIALAVNTMHKVADPIRDAISIQFLDIREAVAGAIERSGAKRSVLLGTNYVVEEDYYFGKIAKKLLGKVELTVLPDAEQAFVHDIIYDELSKGEVKDASRERVAAAIREAIANEQVGSVALACTELPMLKLGELLKGVPIADSTNVHVEACVDFILNQT